MGKEGTSKLTKPLPEKSMPFTSSCIYQEKQCMNSPYNFCFFFPFLKFYFLFPPLTGITMMSSFSCFPAFTPFSLCRFIWGLVVLWMSVGFPCPWILPSSMFTLVILRNTRNNPEEQPMPLVWQNRPGTKVPEKSSYSIAKLFIPSLQYYLVTCDL